MRTFLLPIEIVATTDADATVLQVCLRSILEEGLGQYTVYGDTDDYQEIRVFLSPAIELEGGMLDDRAKREERLRGFWSHFSFRRLEKNEPVEQLAMPGL